jgi:ABC-2 type transport system permease protein
VRDVRDIARAQLHALVRRPAVWTVVAAMAVLNQVFGYLIPYLSYRSGDTTGFDAGQSPRQLLAATAPDQLVPNTTGGFPIFAGALALALGALVAGSEFGWGTVKTLLTQGPGRLAVAAGHLAALTVWIVGTVVLLFALSAVSSVVIAWVEGTSISFPSAGHMAVGVLGGSLVLLVWAVLGAVLAVAVRGVALPIGLGIVWALGVENLVSAMASSVLSALQPIRDLLPGVNAGSLVAAMTPEMVGSPAPGVSETVGSGRALATLAAYLLVACAATAVLVRRRDVT